MITGAHVILYSKDAGADRAFVQDVLGFPHVDVGHGWLIFALPPAELAMHPADEPSHELYLMVDDVKSFIADMKKRGVACSDVHQQPWGSLVNVTLPSGTKLGVYQPRHASPRWTEATKRKAKPRKKSVAKKKRAPKRRSRRS